MAEDDLPFLTQLAEKVLTARIKNGILRYCPTMDLVAAVNVHNQVDIFRLNGQKVLGVPGKKSCETVDIVWKPNGGKIVHRLECSAPPETSICSLSWTISFTDPASVAGRLQNTNGNTTLEDVAHRGFLGELSESIPDLPGDLAALSVENILPKLSILPPGGKSGDVFTSRASIDALFHSKDSRANSADALLVAFTDGSAYLSIHDFFEVGHFVSRRISSGADTWTILKSSAHPYMANLALILDRTKQKTSSLAFLTLDLRLLSDGGKQFSQLATKATQMQNIVRYIKECQVQICSEFRTSQTLPHRFIENVEEDLQEKENVSFATAAYHLVATGDCSPVMKEWLVDQLAERGQKRWEKASISGYENTRRLIHENLLPVLDRLTVLCSRLRGLSLFQPTATTLGLETVEIDHVLDSIRCLQLLSHTALIASDGELRQSLAFCAWLRQEIDTQASESVNPEEQDKEPNLDFLEILAYIQGPLRNSMLYELLDVRNEGDERETTALPSLNDSIYDAFKAPLRRIKEGVQLTSRLPGMEMLIERLQQQCSDIFSRVAKVQQEKVRFGEPTALGEYSHGLCDLHMLPPKTDGTCSTFLAAVVPERNSLRIIELRISFYKGISSLERQFETRVNAGGNNVIVDLKFVDDYDLFVLVEQGGDRVLYSLRYRTKEGDDRDIVLGDSAEAHIHNQQELDLQDESSQATLRRHVFVGSAIPPFVPLKIEVNGRKGRRAACVLSEDMTQYRMLDIDASDQPQEADKRQEEYHEGSDVVMA